MPSKPNLNTKNLTRGDQPVCCTDEYRYSINILLIGTKHFPGLQLEAPSYCLFFTLGDGLVCRFAFLRILFAVLLVPL